jgi:hypothetical protein
MWPTDSSEVTRIEFALGRQLADFAAGEIVALFDRLHELAA